MHRLWQCLESLSVFVKQGNVYVLQFVFSSLTLVGLFEVGRLCEDDTTFSWSRTLWCLLHNREAYTCLTQVLLSYRLHIWVMIYCIQHFVADHKQFFWTSYTKLSSAAYVHSMLRHNFQCSLYNVQSGLTSASVLSSWNIAFSKSLGYSNKPRVTIKTR